MLPYEIRMAGIETTLESVKSRVTTQKVQAKERITTMWRMVNKVQSKEIYSFFLAIQVDYTYGYI